MRKSTHAKRFLAVSFVIITISLAFIGCDSAIDANEYGTGSETVNLRTAGDYVILAKTKISTVPASAITGDIGLTPAATSYLTGFDLTNATGYATSDQITGKAYAADMVSPTSSNLTTAAEDMITAYNDAASRSNPDELNYLGGLIGGETLEPGLYRWTGTVGINSNLTFSGSSTDTWVLQIAGDLSLANDTAIMLSGGAVPENIFWQVAGAVTMGTTSHFEGIVLTQTAITMNTGASMNGRLLAQTAVALDSSTVVEPAL